MKESLNEFLKPTYFCESDDPEIVRLARKIVGKKKGKAAAVALFNWVRDNKKYNIIKIVGAADTLKNKSAISFDKTNILIALCRASGIPARYLQLKCIMNSKIRPDIAKSDLHIPAEICVNGKWHFADPTFSNDTKRLIDKSEFGKPTYKKILSEKRYSSLSRIQVFIVNLIIPRLKVLKELQKVLDEVRNQKT